MNFSSKLTFKVVVCFKIARIYLSLPSLDTDCISILLSGSASLLDILIMILEVVSIAIVWT